MVDFSNRELFAPLTHPESGVTFHVLTRKVDVAMVATATLLEKTT